MSISATLTNALSGLGASARTAEVVSSNISNATTDGFGRREVHLEPRWLGGTSAGVHVAGISRNVDQYLIGERRLAASDLALDGGRSEFWDDLRTRLGAPDDPASITGLIDTLDASLIEAASRPDSIPRLDGVFRSAERLARFLNDTSDYVQNQRMRADQEIARNVSALNEALAQIHEMNVNIRANASAGHDVNALMDQRQIAIDRLADIVPIHTARRPFDQVAIYTSGGAILLDGPPAPIDFAAVGVITPGMSVNSGALSEIFLRGRPVSAVGNGPLSGGRLGALFEVRDQLAVSAQADLDAIARNLIERMSAAGVDPTLSAGTPGMFTDAGTAMLATNEVGVSARISVNQIVDPSNGGQLWHIRDGLGATTSGNVGDASLLQSLSDALTNLTAPASGSFVGFPRSASGLAAEFLSLVNGKFGSATQARDFAQSRHDTFKAAELRGGVDSDTEMRNLMMIEQAYAANARVVSTADEMLQILINL